MTFADLSSYFLTLIAIAVAPGPVVLMLMVRAAGNDVAGALGFSFGFALGGLAIITAVCFGMSAWLTAVPEVLDYSKYVMMAYISYLAIGIWRGGFNLDAEMSAAKRPALSSICAGVITCFISPYMMILFPLVLPGMMDIALIEMPEFLIIAIATFGALSCGAVLIVLFAAQLRRLARSPRAMRILNRSLASILMLGGGWMALG